MTKATAGLDIQPLSEVIAQVKGIDLSEPPDSDTVAAITDAWHEHIVLPFRDQEIDADQQIAFAENFGDVGVRSRLRRAPSRGRGLQCLNNARL